MQQVENSLEITYILFELPYSEHQARLIIAALFHYEIAFWTHMYVLQKENVWFVLGIGLKFIYSEKATKFEKKISSNPSSGNFFFKFFWRS